jgi:hypothetical protein
MGPPGIGSHISLLFPETQLKVEPLPLPPRASARGRLSPPSIPHAVARVCVCDSRSFASKKSGATQPSQLIGKDETEQGETIEWEDRRIVLSHQCGWRLLCTRIQEVPTFVWGVPKLVPLG